MEGCVRQRTHQTPVIIDLPQVVTQVAHQVEQHEDGMHDLVAFRHGENLLKILARHLMQGAGQT